MPFHGNKILTTDEAFEKLSDIDNSVIISGTINESSDEEKALIKSFFSVNDTKLERTFDIYFHWFNIVHELCHIVMNNNGFQSEDLIEVETMANQIAAAFWRTFGDPAMYQELQSIVTRALENIDNPIPSGTSFTDFYNDYISMPDDTMSIYAFFQFTLVSDALSSTQTLNNILISYGLKANAEVSSNAMKHMSEKTDPQEIIDTAISIFSEMGFTLPRVTILYCDNPNVQCAPK